MVGITFTKRWVEALEGAGLVTTWIDVRAIRRWHSESGEPILAALVEQSNILYEAFRCS